MSWDADFAIRGTDEWHVLNDWNYTHNTNAMIAATLDPKELAATVNPWWDELGGRDGVRSWWTLLDGASGSAGTFLLSRIITGLEAEPDRFRAMNPENGWGDYDRLLVVLKQMHELSRDFPLGKWSASG